MEIITSNNVTVTDENKKNIQTGVQWLDNWFQKRLSDDEITKDLNYSATHGDNLPHWQETYQEYSDKLNNVTIIVGKDAADIENIIKESIQSDKLHFNKRYLKRHKNDQEMAIEKFKVNTNGGYLYGMYCKNIEEPVIFLTENALDNNILSSVITHECTHMLELYTQEQQARNSLDMETLNFNDKISMYLDSAEEVYARTMQFRKAFNLDPNKKYTLEEIAQLRAEYEKNTDVFGNFKKSLPKKREFSQDELDKAMQKARSKVNLEQQNLQQDFLDRYTDEQIMNLLNDTALIDMPLQNDYDVLKNDMQKDLALSSAKIKVFEKMHKDQDKPEDKEQTSKVEKRELDITTIQKTNEIQYS